MIKWIRTSRLSINKSLSRAGQTRVDRADDEIPGGVGEHIPKRCGFDRAPGREQLDLVPHLSRALDLKPQIRARLGTTAHFCEVVTRPASPRAIPESGETSFYVRIRQLVQTLGRHSRETGTKRKLAQTIERLGWQV